jgi:hypothetical protein
VQPSNSAYFATKEFRSAETDANGVPNIILNSQTGEATLNNATIRTLNGSNSPYGFYENGKKESFITLSRQVVRLLGFGTSGGFGGWIVLSREDFLSEEMYGKAVKALCYGKITGTPSGASITYSCFDYYWNDSSVVHRSLVEVSRQSTGVYRVSFPVSWNIPNINDNYIVLCTGGVRYNGALSGIYASVIKMDPTYFDVMCADDHTANDGTFYFQMINLGGWL